MTAARTHSDTDFETLVTRVRTIAGAVQKAQASDQSFADLAHDVRWALLQSALCRAGFFAGAVAVGLVGLAFVATDLQGRPCWPLLYATIPSGLMFVRRFTPGAVQQEWRDAPTTLVQALAECDDVRIVPLLLDVLAFGGDEGTCRVGARGLLRLLPAMDSGSFARLSRSQRAVLYHALRWRLSPPRWRAFDNTHLTLAVLDAVARAHDIRVRPLVVRLAQSANDEPVLSAARRCLISLDRG